MTDHAFAPVTPGEMLKSEFLEEYGLSQNQLARAIGITEASLVRTLHQLEHAGLIARQPGRDDRRANRLVLSDRGATLAARIDERLIALRAELLADICDDELDTTMRVLDHVAQRIVERRGRP